MGVLAKYGTALEIPDGTAGKTIPNFKNPNAVFGWNSMVTVQAWHVHTCLTRSVL